MREPSMMVQETTTEQLKDYQSDWAYSKPVVILDVLWKMGLVWWLRKWGKIFGDGDLELGFLVICDVGNGKG